MKKSLCILALLLSSCSGSSNNSSSNSSPNTTTLYSISGNISGLAGTLVLKINTGDELTLNSNGDFSFPSLLNDGSDYSVSIIHQPNQQNCGISGESGRIHSANVSNIKITCSNSNNSSGNTPDPSPNPNPDPSPDPNPNPNPDPGWTPPTNTCAEGERQFVITNNSNQEVWLGIAAGTMSCASDADCPTSTLGSCVGAGGGAVGVCTCPTGSECGSLAQCNFNNHFCFWNLPSMTKDQMNLAPGAESSICFQAAANGKNIQWSGNLFARTGCDSQGQNCKTGECGSSTNGPCPTGTGGNPPATLAEFTLTNQSNFNNPIGPDYYDVSIINGMNVGISMSPISGSYEANNSDPYFCQSPGSSTGSSQLPACNWTVNPSVSGTDYSTLLRDVAPHSFGTSCPDGGSPNYLGYCNCSTDSDCSSQGLSCGVAMNASASQFTKVCGSPVGWWTADQLCGVSDNSSSALAPLSCSSTITNHNGSTSTYRDLHLCTGVQNESCYSIGASVDCCGCATSAAADNEAWASSPLEFGGPDNGCYNNNPQWVSIVQPWLVFLKNACPTAYTYAYDDATSTFTCKGTSSTGAPNYHINFLPLQ